MWIGLTYVNIHFSPFPQFAGPGPMVKRPDSYNDRHVIAKHKVIYPKEDELQAIQKIVTNTEKALKSVSGLWLKYRFDASWTKLRICVLFWLL